MLVQFCGFVNHHHKEIQSQNKPGTTLFLYYKSTGTNLVHRISYFSKVLEIPLTSISKLSKCLNAVFELGPEDHTLANWICYFFFLVMLLEEFPHFSWVKTSKIWRRVRKAESWYYVVFWHSSFTNCTQLSTKDSRRVNKKMRRLQSYGLKTWRGKKKRSCSAKWHKEGNYWCTRRTWTSMNRLYFMVADGVWQFYTTHFSCSPCMQFYSSVISDYYKITTTC